MPLQRVLQFQSKFRNTVKETFRKFSQFYSHRFLSQVVFLSDEKAIVTSMFLDIFVSSLVYFIRF